MYTRLQSQTVASIKRNETSTRGRVWSLGASSLCLTPYRFSHFILRREEVSFARSPIKNPLLIVSHHSEMMGTEIRRKDVFFAILNLPSAWLDLRHAEHQFHFPRDQCAAKSQRAGVGEGVRRRHPRQGGRLSKAAPILFSGILEFGRTHRVHTSARGVRTCT